MLINLNIQMNTDTGDIQIVGVPCAQLPTGEQKVLKHLCYAALESAKDTIRDFKPGEHASPIAIASRIPNLNGGLK